jgi:hypothetical protein
VASTLRYLNISHNLLSGVVFESDPTWLFDILDVFDASSITWNFECLMPSLPCVMLRSPDFVILRYLNIAIHIWENAILTIHAPNDLSFTNLQSQPLKGAWERWGLS